MSRKGTRSIAEPIAQLQRELEEYRRMPPRRAKLPESIWEAAAELVWPENSIYLKQREIIPGVVDNETTRCQSAGTRSVSC